MAHRNPPRPWAPMDMCLTSEAEFDLLCSTLAISHTHKQQAPTSPAMQAHRCRRTHGHVTIKTRTSQQTGFAALLCIESGFISVVGGAVLDDTILSMPLRYAELKVVPGHENVLELKVKNPDAKPNGILVEVSDCSVRDRWLEAFSAVGVKIEGHIGDHTVTMAHRNPPRLWAPSSMCLTSEAEFDLLCSNDESDRRSSKRETQTRLRAIIENLVDSKELLYLTFILAVTQAHAILGSVIDCGIGL